MEPSSQWVSACLKQLSLLCHYLVISSIMISQSNLEEAMQDFPAGFDTTLLIGQHLLSE